MADIPASALLGQFAEEITPAGQTVFGLKAQPFADNNGAALGDIHDTDRGNVSITLARKAALVTECQRIGLTARRLADEGVGSKDGRRRVGAASEALA